MRNLINFLIKNSVMFLFLFLEIISVVLIVKSQNFHQSIYLTSSNAVSGKINEWSSSVIDYFKLVAVNENLSKENTALKNQVILLQSKLSTLNVSKNDSFNISVPPEMQYRFIAAKVINCSTNKLYNYITLNKGSKDGIKPDMGVISESGVVGIVKAVNDEYAVVIPILNPKIEISCRIKSSQYSGPLHWEGFNCHYASLNDIARHVVLKKKDTLVTSGFVNNFPEGIPVGYIEDFRIKESDAYYNIKVRLAVDFRTLIYVKVINYLNHDKQKELEQKAEKN